MGRPIARPALWVTGLAVVLASCGGDGAAPTTSSTVPADTTSTAAITTTTTTGTTTSTSTTLPGGPPLATEGDHNEIVEAFQFLLNCNGFGDLEVDGAFGPLTLAAVEAAQRSLGREANGAPDEETLAELSRSCSERRRLEDAEAVTVVGNAAPGDPEIFAVALLSDSVVTIALVQGDGLNITVIGADGVEVVPQDDSSWRIDTTQDYSIEVAAPVDPTMFALDIEVATGVPETGDWILATDGLSYRGTSLTLGSDAQTVIDQVFEFLGHGVRGAYDEFDTGWYTITDPGDMGLRGVFVEGFALLFFGPDPNNPDRPETFVRHRFLGPTLDAEGNPRGDDYATTAEGITVGDTLADLQAAYGSRVTAGSNSEEHYYRLADSHGVLCFYFGTEDAPGEYSAITEIASECRTG